MAAATIAALHIKRPWARPVSAAPSKRLRPALARCYADMAKRASHNHFGGVDSSVVIDDPGRVRSPHVAGDRLPGLEACLAGVASRLVTSAPDTDTGAVTALLVLNFTP
jgi:hypothetical protein